MFTRWKAVRNRPCQDKDGVARGRVPDGLRISELSVPLFGSTCSPLESNASSFLAKESLSGTGLRGLWGNPGGSLKAEGCVCVSVCVCGCFLHFRLPF